MEQGSYRQDCVKFKDFSKTIQQLKKNTDLHVKILLLKSSSPLLKVSVLYNKYKIVVPLFGAAYAASNKGTTILQ